MKILQLVPELRAGGVERGTVDLARILIAKGHEPHVISAGGELVEELEQMGAHHLTLPIHRKGLKTLALVKTLVRYIEENGIEIVHARSRVPAWVGYLAARYTDAEFVTTCHGYYSDHFLSRVMGWGKRVIVISNVIARHMIDDFKVPEERIRLIPRGIHLAEFPYCPLETRLCAKNGVLRILNIGRLTPIKGHEDFIRALHWMKQRGKRFEASIVGDAPPSKQDYARGLEQLVKKLGLEDHVKFLGTRRDIAQLLRTHHLLVLSTTVPEAFGRVVAEAGAVGTAVVATRVGGVTDIVRDGVDGRLVPSGEPRKMAEAMIEVLENREETIRFSRSLSERVRERFRLDQMYEATLAVYEEVLAEKKFLIIKLGALGDLILITPSLRLLRRRFPKAKIALLVDEKFYEVAASLPAVDEIIVYHREKERGGVRRFLKLAKKLREMRFDLSVDFQNTWKTHLLSYLACIPKRLGYRRGLLGFLLTRAQEGFRDPLPPVPHQMRILRGLGLGVGWCDDRIELHTREQVRARVGELLAEAGLGAGELAIGFSLCASGKWPSKNWPLEHYRELARLLLAEFPARLVLIGTPAEKETAEAFVRGLGSERIINLAARTSAGEMLEVIRRLDLFVGPDSAPLHASSGFQVPWIGLFGPTDSRRHAPPGEKRAIFQKSVSCGPCYKRTCRVKEHPCMRTITVDEVYLAARRFLRERMPVPAPQAE